MTHSISQWKIRLLSLMVATSVFTGGMATLAEPVGAKHKSKKAKKAKARKANHNDNDNGNGNGNGGGAHASTESNKTMTQQATTSNDQQQQSVQVIAPCAINVNVQAGTNVCTNNAPANQQFGPTGGMSSSNTGNQIDSQSNNAGAANQGG
jgi:hypothetical protein